MAEVELHLNDLSAPELIATGNRFVAGLADNPHFPDAKAELDAMKKKLEQLAAAQEEYRTHRLELNDLKTARDVLMNEAKAALNAGAAHVQEASGGDAKKIVSAHLSAEPHLEFLAIRLARAGDRPFHQQGGELRRN